MGLKAATVEDAPGAIARTEPALPHLSYRPPGFRFHFDPDAETDCVLLRRFLFDLHSPDVSGVDNHFQKFSCEQPHPLLLLVA
jgi:hypothetical protein